jgi:hypothetical protein
VFVRGCLYRGGLTLLLRRLSIQHRWRAGRSRPSRRFHRKGRQSVRNIGNTVSQCPSNASASDVCRMIPVYPGLRGVAMALPNLSTAHNVRTTPVRGGGIRATKRL